MWPFKKKDKPKQKKQGLVFSSGSFGFEDIDEKAQGTRYRWLGGDWVEVFVKTPDGLKPFIIRDYVPGKVVLPDKLYRGLKWKVCVQPLFKLPKNWMDKVNMWLGIALIGILLLAMFLLYQAIRGG